MISKIKFLTLERRMAIVLAPIYIASGFVVLDEKMVELLKVVDTFDAVALAWCLLLSLRALDSRMAELH